MGLNKDEEALRVADEIFKEILVLRQYGTPAGISPKNAQKKIDTMIEHFVRRDEPESAYYETLGDHNEYTSCVCGAWDEDLNIMHGVMFPCYFIDTEEN